MLEVVLAKPQTDKRTEGVYSHAAGVHPRHLPRAGYGSFAGTAYGSVGTGLGGAAAAGLPQVLEYTCKSLFAWIEYSYNRSHRFARVGQPMIYGRGPMPAGMHMVPMVLPDGRIGYVL